MNKVMSVGLLALLLVGCKVGGTAKGVSEPIELVETNTGNRLTVTHDGLFMFDEDYPAGTAYNVEIRDSKEHVCKVVNGQGIVRASVGDIKVKC